MKIEMRSCLRSHPLEITRLKRDRTASRVQTFSPRTDLSARVKASRCRAEEPFVSDGFKSLLLVVTCESQRRKSGRAKEENVGGRSYVHTRVVVLSTLGEKRDREKKSKSVGRRYEYRVRALVRSRVSEHDLSLSRNHARMWSGEGYAAHGDGRRRRKRIEQCMLLSLYLMRDRSKVLITRLIGEDFDLKDSIELVCTTQVSSVEQGCFRASCRSLSIECNRAFQG